MGIKDLFSEHQPDYLSPVELDGQRLRIPKRQDSSLSPQSCYSNRFIVYATSVRIHCRVFCLSHRVVTVLGKLAASLFRVEMTSLNKFYRSSHCYAVHSNFAINISPLAATQSLYIGHINFLQSLVSPWRQRDFLRRDRQLSY
jgi:hypothetical protein